MIGRLTIEKDMTLYVPIKRFVQLLVVGEHTRR